MPITFFNKSENLVFSKLFLSRVGISPRISEKSNSDFPKVGYKWWNFWGQMKTLSNFLIALQASDIY